MNNILLLIFLCAIVTFIPRLIPAIFVNRLEFGDKFKKFLNLLPYTALAALICPGVLTVDAKLWYVGLVGAIVAGALSWKKVPLGAIVIITVIALIIFYTIIGFLPIL